MKNKDLEQPKKEKISEEEKVVENPVSQPKEQKPESKVIVDAAYQD